MSNRIIAIDVGGTNIKYGFVEDGDVKEANSVLTEANRGPECVLQKLESIIHKYSPTATSAGLAIAGLVDHRAGIVYSPPNLPGWDAIEVKKILTARTGVNCFVLNDANSYALGEWIFGGGKGFGNVIAITLGTGVGGGIIVGGKLVLGSVSFAGEIGHMVIDPSGPSCNCGQRGCWESFLGSGYFTQRARSFFEREGKPLADLTPEAVALLGKSGDKYAKVLWDEYGYFLGIGLVNLIHLFDPEIIIIGGGISGAYDLFIDSSLKVLRERVMGFERRKVKIAKALLGDSASLLGAYYFALREGDV